MEASHAASDSTPTMTRKEICSFDLPNPLKNLEQRYVRPILKLMIMLHFTFDARQASAACVSNAVVPQRA